MLEDMRAALAAALQGQGATLPLNT